ARAPGTRAPRGDYELSTDNYLCVEKALAKQVPDEVIDNSDDPLTPLVRATEYVTDKMFMNQEIDILDLVFGTGWASSATPGTLWSNDAADPLGDIETGMNTVALAIGREPNTGVIGRGLWRYMKNHPDIVDRIKYGQTPGSPARVTEVAVAALVGLDRLLVARAIKNTAQEGAADSFSFIGGNHMSLLYVTGSAAIDEPSAGYLFSWMGREVNRFVEDQEHAQVVEARESWDTKLTASDSGYLLKSAA
ncbi:hypothetical protein LCGC14_1373170, partial [marine sediment metagenome]